MVDRGNKLEDVLVLFDSHLVKTGIAKKRWCFMTCGD